MKKLKQWFIGDYLAKTPDVFAKAKIELLYNYCVAYFILGAFFYVGLFFKGLHYHIYVISLAVVGLFSIPFILKYTQSLKSAAVTLIVQQLVISCLSMIIQQGQQDMTGGLWTAVFVAMSLFLFERVWGVILIVIMCAMGGVVGALTQNIYIPKEEKLKGSPDEFLLPLLLLIVIVWQFLKARAEAEDHIRKQRLQLEISNKEIEMRNKDVTDSINYAKRIQYAVLPSQESIQRSIPLSFLFYLPKDIVSGDFYWFHEISKDEYIIVCGDCTGHGVPGAFMTVIGSNLLNQIVIDNKVYEPGKILMNLDELLNSTLKQDKQRQQGVQDGMDMSLIKVNKQKKECIITSAKRPVVLIRNKEMKEFKGSKHSLGGMRSGEKHFEEIKFNYEEDDVIFSYTDGITDQFGGEKGKKYSSKRLKEFLVGIHEETALVQKQKLELEFGNWTGHHEQVDDVCVLGIRF